MPLTGNENHDITLQEAAELTANYRATISSGGILGHLVSKSAISSILDQTGCVGLRVYYGLDTTNEVPQLIFVGVDQDGNDIYEGLLADKTVLCPNLCSATNPLNSDT